MDDENQREKFQCKILARDSCVGYSSRIYYYNSGEGIPFKWEMQPGIAKDCQPKEELPPLSPPPAVLSLGLPKPCIELTEPRPSARSRILYFFWEKGTRIGKSNKKLLEEESKEYSGDDANNNGFDVFARLKRNSYSVSMAKNSSFSSSSSSSSLMKGGRESWWSTSTRRYILERPLGCFHGNISSIARRD